MSERKIYIAEHKYENKGDGGVNLYVFTACAHPDESAVVQFMDINFEPDKGEELEIYPCGSFENLPFLAEAIPPEPRFYNAAVAAAMSLGLDTPVVEWGDKPIYTILTDRFGYSVTGTPVSQYMLDAMYSDFTFVAMNHEGEIGILIELEFPTLESDDDLDATYAMWADLTDHPSPQFVAKFLDSRLQVLNRSHGCTVSIDHNGVMDRTVAHVWFHAVGPVLADNVKAACDWLRRETKHTCRTEED